MTVIGEEVNEIFRVSDVGRTLIRATTVKQLLRSSNYIKKILTENVNENIRHHLNNHKYTKFKKPYVF